MKYLFFIFFAWIGRTTYNCRAWLETIQDWADSRADRWNQVD